MKLQIGIFKIRKIGILLMGFIIFGGLNSCNEDYLNLEPLDALSDASVWKDINLTEAAVNAIFTTLEPGWQERNRFSIMSDEGYERDQNNSLLVQRGEVTPSNTGYIGFAWKSYYSKITKANKFLSEVTGENLEALKKVDEDKINRLIGEVIFIRAYAYSKLTAHYKDVPLITEPFGLSDDFSVPRDPYATVRDFIIAELDKAIDLLPEEHSGEERGRVTKGAALSIKARVHQFAASPLFDDGNASYHWGEAAKAVEDIEALDLYSLHPDYTELFTEAALWNDEAIFVFQKEMDLLFIWNYRIERKMYPPGNGGWKGMVPTQNQVDIYETINGLSIADDPAYDSNFPYANRDPRLNGSILHQGSPFLYLEGTGPLQEPGEMREIDVVSGGLDAVDGPHMREATAMGYYPLKFLTVSSDQVSSDGGRGSQPNWAYTRLGEMFLIMAEAQYYLDNEAVAREYLNKVRSRESVDMPDVTATGADLEALIRNERRVELFLEEHRYFDIRRWKLTTSADGSTGLKDMIWRTTVTRDGAGVLSYAYEGWKDFALPTQMYLAPVPSDEIDKDPNLLPNNPGY
jgi:hypothetical protein